MKRKSLLANAYKNNKKEPTSKLKPTATTTINSKATTKPRDPTNALKPDLAFKSKATMKDSSAIKPITLFKTRSPSAITTKNRLAPVRAVDGHQPNAIAVSNKNVMNTIHNVTVISPPSVRKAFAGKVDLLNVDAGTNSVLRRERTRTRTLGPDEVLVLPKQMHHEVENIISVSDHIKEPVAFEIKFEHIPQPSKRTGKEANANFTSNKKVDDETQLASSEEASQEDYEDDFDSYESDFDSYSNSTETSLSNTTKAKVENSNHEQGMDSGLFELKPPDMDAVHNIHTYDDVEAQIDSGFGFVYILTLCFYFKRI